MEKSILEKIYNENSRIKQIYISTCVRAFTNIIRNKYNLEPYNDINQPAIFFGLYKESDYMKLSHHRSLAVVIYAGTDALNVYSHRYKDIYINYISILRQNNVKLLSISKWILNDLISIDIKSKYINFNLIDEDIFSPVKKGKSIYIYTSKRNPVFYGSNIYGQIIKELPDINFIITTKASHKRDKLRDVYGKCFIGLRLTAHDGNANTVQELGLCGIKCIHNGLMPNAIRWDNKDDIIKNILEEQKTVGQIDNQMADKVKNFLDVDNKDPSWLYTNHYKSF